MVSLLSGSELSDSYATVGPSRPSNIKSVPVLHTPVLDTNENDATNDSGPVPNSTSFLSAATAVTSEVPSVSRISVQNVGKRIPPKLSSSAVDPTTASSTTVATASEVPSISIPPTPSHDGGESEPSKPLRGGADPATGKDNGPNWKSTLYAGAKVVIDVVKEMSDACTPLKSVAGGISAVLKYYDVCHSFF